jgi:gliding motility-associated-like protein
MKKKLVLLQLFLPIILLGQLNINTSFTPQQLVEDYLIGPGITVSNVTYRGQLSQFGFFSNGNTTALGMNEGIILCTGNATQIAQSASSFMSNSLGGNGVPELDSIINNPTYDTNDGAVLEFDFIPQDTMLSFYYIFGSEEYPEYVCSSFNDIFAFLISGINPLGGMYVDKNIALIPGTNLPVAINSVNSGSPGIYGSASNCMSLSYSQYYTSNSYQQPVFDGFTVPLVAIAKVIPCQTYHIKLCIADVSDGAYDSGVFLKRNSFITNQPVINIASPYASQDTIYEGCAPIKISISHPDPVPVPTNVYLGLSGTATIGDDCTNLPSVVTIPADSTSVTYTLYAYPDALNEGDESIIIVIGGFCGIISSDTIWIKDNPFKVNLSDTIICENEGPITLNPTIIDGNQPYSFIWNTGATSSNITVSPNSTTVFSVTVTDSLSCNATAEATITVNPLPNVSINPEDTTICRGNGVSLVVSGADNYIWSNGNTDETLVVTPNSTTTYSVTATNLFNCSNSAQATINVIPMPELVISASPPAICVGESTRIRASGADNYVWNTGDSTNQIIVAPEITTSYTVTGFIENCNVTNGITIEVYPTPDVILTVSQTHILQGDIIDLQAEGAIDYQWYGDNSISCLNCDIITAAPKFSDEICVVGFNSNCTDTACVYIEVDPCEIFIPNAFTPIKNDLNDTWQISTQCPIDIGELKIYDRWGKQIFYTTNLTDSWDGTYNGEKVKPGVYSYKILFSYSHTPTIFYTYQGSIMIVE